MYTSGPLSAESFELAARIEHCGSAAHGSTRLDRLLLKAAGGVLLQRLLANIWTGGPRIAVTIDQLETPALVVDLDILESNIARLAKYAAAHGLLVRPHTKTHKIPAIARLQMDAGSHGITVAKSTEAQVMAAAGLDNILVAYPVFGEAKLQRLANLALERKITIAIDSAIAVENISRAAQSVGANIDLLVEMDVGMHRCGMKSAKDVLVLARLIDQRAGVLFAGLNLYPGHIWSAPEMQSAELAEVNAKLDEGMMLLTQNGLQCTVVSGGSTPTALQSHQITGLTEIRPGTYVFNDRNTLGVGACSLEDCALRVLVTVVSTAVPEQAIVDGGSKSFSSDRLLSGSGDGFGLVAEDSGIRFERMSEEHGHLKLSAGCMHLRVGDRLSIIPNHVCACVNLHNQIWYHRHGVVQGFWNVEGRGCVQ